MLVTLSQESPGALALSAPEPSVSLLNVARGLLWGASTSSWWRLRWTEDALLVSLRAWRPSGWQEKEIPHQHTREMTIEATLQEGQLCELTLILHPLHRFLFQVERVDLLTEAEDLAFRVASLMGLTLYRIEEQSERRLLLRFCRASSQAAQAPYRGEALPEGFQLLPSLAVHAEYDDAPSNPHQITFTPLAATSRPGGLQRKELSSSLVHLHSEPLRRTELLLARVRSLFNALGALLLMLMGGAALLLVSFMGLLIFVGLFNSILRLFGVGASSDSLFSWLFYLSAFFCIPFTVYRCAEESALRLKNWKPPHWRELYLQPRSGFLWLDGKVEELSATDIRAILLRRTKSQEHHTCELSILCGSREHPLASHRAPDANEAMQELLPLALTLCNALSIGRSVKPFINPSTHTLSCITGDTTGRMFIAGEQGLLLRSIDDGLHWSRCEAGTSDNIWALCARGGVLIAVGARGLLLRSTDGENLQPLKVTDSALFSVCATDDNTFIAVGSNGVILRSTDQGETWQPQQSPSKKNLFAVAAHENTLVAVGAGVVLLSSDGASWREVFQPGDDVTLLTAMVDGARIIVAGKEGKCFLSTDGGRSFTRDYSPPKGDIHHIIKGSDGSLYLAGRQGLMSCASKSGFWRDTLGVSSLGVQRREAPGALTALGDRGELREWLTGEAPLEPMTVRASNTAYSVWQAPSERLWCVGAQGMILTVPPSKPRG